MFQGWHFNREIIVLCERALDPIPRITRGGSHSREGTRREQSLRATRQNLRAQVLADVTVMVLWACGLGARQCPTNQSSGGERPWEDISE